MSDSEPGPNPDVASAFQRALAGCANFEEMAAVVNKILYLGAERMVQDAFGGSDVEKPGGIDRASDSDSSALGDHVQDDQPASDRGDDGPDCE